MNRLFAVLGHLRHTIVQIKCCHKLLQILRSSFTFQHCTHIAYGLMLQCVIDFRTIIGLIHCAAVFILHS